MKTIRHLFLLVLFFASANGFAQTGQIDSVKFFQDESIIDVTLEMDMKDLLGKKQKERFLPATITMAFRDGESITEQIRVSVRGNFRRETCYMPGLKLDFHNPTSKRLYKLDKLKMVCGCGSGSDNEQLVLKEYMVYKMYNQFTERSLRVRLLKVTFKDAAGKKKPYVQHAFFLEDIDEMAKRHNMIEVEGSVYNTELTDRQQMTMVAMFEYMIGNTDWSVPNYHNIKLMGSKDKSSRPIAIPYDFDICGFVDPAYATVDEQLNIENVRQRLYRGFARSMDELQSTIKIFNEKKDVVYALIQSFPLFEQKTKQNCIGFIDEFYKSINSPKVVQAVFIDGARTQ